MCSLLSVQVVAGLPMHIRDQQSSLVLFCCAPHITAFLSLRARQVWHMSLDNTRNRTLQTNLTISIGSLALTTATLPAAIFGMNLHSGWEVRSGRLPSTRHPIPRRIRGVSRAREGGELPRAQLSQMIDPSPAAAKSRDAAVWLIVVVCDNMMVGLFISAMYEGAPQHETSSTE